MTDSSSRAAHEESSKAKQKKPRRHRRSHERRRQAIIEASTRVIAQEGFSAATMDRIAKEASIGKATLYYYFPNKGVLIKEALTIEVSKFREFLLERMQHAETYRDASRSLLKGFYDYLTPNREVLQLFLSVIREFFRDPKSFVVGEQIQGFHQPLVNILMQTAKDDGLKLDPMQFNFIVGTFLIGYLHRVLTLPTAMDLDHDIAAIEQLMYFGAFQEPIA